jgi:hypothetical protein
VGGKGRRCRAEVQIGQRPVQKCKGKARFQSTEYRVPRGLAGKETRGHGGGGTEAEKVKGRERR